MDKSASAHGGFRVIDCLTGRVMLCRGGRLIDSGDGVAAAVSSLKTESRTSTDMPGAIAAASGCKGAHLSLAGAGLVDLQVNGVGGVDFNCVSITPQDVLKAVHLLLARGVTTFFPVVVTNSVENMCNSLSVIDLACRRYPLVSSCVEGIHLEGPFISPEDGFRGAHPVEHIREADWELFSRLRSASGDRIRIVAVSPERDKAAGFVKRCAGEGLIVTIAHSAANSCDIERAVDAGAIMASHIGNGIPVMLRRHPNVLWDILSCDNLFVCMIADGFHLPSSFIKVVLAAKPGKVLLTSDATCFAGRPPGVYRTHIGGEVELDEAGRLSMLGGGGLLAGAALTLERNVEYMAGNGLVDLAGAWRMASEIPGSIVWAEEKDRKTAGDMVVFDIIEGNIEVSMVWKDGVPVWDSGKFT